MKDPDLIDDMDPTAFPRISPEDAALSGAVLLDIRDDDEWAAGHIEGSVHEPLAQFDPAATPPAPLVLVCRSGRRAERAAALLRQAAHSHPTWILDGGILAWARSGLPIVTGAGPGAVL